MEQTDSALSLDIGTSSVRALLWDSHGREIPDCDAQIPYHMTITPDGGMEIPAPELLSLVAQCLDRALARCGERAASVRAVGISSFWHSLLGLDAHGAPLTPVYSWADTRAGHAASLLRDELDAAAVHARTGCPLHSSYYPAKLRWLRETQPELFRRAARWVSPAEYLFSALFGPDACRVSVSMASGTGLLRQDRCDWDLELLDAVGVVPGQLSPIIDLDSPSRGLREPFAARWPALRNTPFVPAIGDGACSNVGSGCIASDGMAINLGTSGAVRVTWREACAESGFAAVAPPGLWRYRIDSRRAVMGAAFSDGGDVFAWLLQTLRLPEGEALEAAVSSCAPGSHGLIVLPFLAGERSFGWNPEAHGVLAGLTLHTDGVGLTRACMEAIALRFAPAVEQLRMQFPNAERIVASGAALGHSPAWAQILADALGETITRAEESEASSRGAALLALESVGLLENLEMAPARLGRSFVPDPSRHARYREMRMQQEELYGRIFASTASPPAPRAR